MHALGQLCLTALRGLAIALAWLFTAGSLVTLILVMVGGLLHPGSVSRVWAWGNNGSNPVVHIYQIPAAQTPSPAESEELQEAIGLTYRGYRGVGIAALQALLVTACAILSVRGRRPRRLGALIILCAWAALWCSNALWMWLASPSTGSQASAGIMGLFFACTVIRAWLSWNHKAVTDATYSSHRAVTAD